MVDQELGSRADDVKPKRGRPPYAAKPAYETPAVPEAPEAARLIEVELLRKYAPVHVYERVEERCIPAQMEWDQRFKKEVEVAPAVVVMQPVVKPDGSLIDQAKQEIGETDDRFGRKIKVYQEVLTSYPARTIIALPIAEARRLLNAGAALITARTPL